MLMMGQVRQTSREKQLIRWNLDMKGSGYVCAYFQSRQMSNPLSLSAVFIERGASVASISIEQDILSDSLARPVRDAPHFVVFAGIGHVFCHGLGFGDEPAHIEDLEFAIIVVPPRRCPCVAARRVVFTHDLGPIMFPRHAGLDFHSLGLRRQSGEAFHESAAHDGRPAIWGLHYFDVRGDAGADGFAEVGGLAEAADEEDGFHG